MNSFMIFFDAGTTHAEVLHEGAQTFAQDNRNRFAVSPALSRTWHGMAVGKMAHYHAEGHLPEGQRREGHAA